MSKKSINLIGAAFSLLAGLALLAPASHADSQSCSAAGCTTTAIPVNFSITIPTVLRLTIGTAGTTPTVSFDGTVLTAANVGTGTAVTASGVTNSGTATPGAVAYSLISNVSNSSASIAASGPAAGLVSGANIIPYTDITAIATGVVSMPVAGSSTSVSPTSGLINESGTWTYRYANTTLYPAGTYTGTINYTATQP